jgi:hypothetical protein
MTEARLDKAVVDMVLIGLKGTSLMDHNPNKKDT